MKLKEMQKRTGLKLAAIIVIGGVLMFTFTGCDKPAEPVAETVAIEEVVEMAEEDGAIAGGLYAEESTLEDGQEEAITEQYTIDFMDAGNEDIITEKGSLVVIPEYERPLIKDIIGEVFDNFDENDTENYTILETTENEDGTKTYLVSLASEDLALGCTTQYSVDENGNAKALFVYMPINYEDLVAEDFGLNFEIKVDKESKVEITKIVDLFGNDCSNIPYYSGEFIGWSMTKAVDYVEINVLDELSILQDLRLYPVFEGGDNAADVDTSEGFWVMGYTGVPVQVGSEYSEKDLNFVVVDGEVISVDGTKIVDPETGVITDAPAEIKGTDGSETEAGTGTEQEKGSTTGTATETNPQQGGGSANIVEYTLPQLSPEEIAKQLGITYGGDGGPDLGSPGDSGTNVTWN